MQKLSVAISFLFVSFTSTVAFAEDGILITAPSTCAEWKSGVNVDAGALDKLQKNAVSEKPEGALLYTKSQFVVLLAKNVAKAKNILATSKDKLPKTSDGLVDLRDITVNGFNLSGLNFDSVDFKGAEMNGADLSGSSFRGASLSKVELDGANLNNANLSYANLTKTKFKFASLCRATLVAADLDSAVLLGAYLKEAKLDTAKNIPAIIYQNALNILQFGLPVPPEN